LRERLHQFHGPAAWIVKLDDESIKKMDVDSLLRWVAKVHSNRSLEDAVGIQKPVIAENMADFLRTWKITEKNTDTILDLYSSSLILAALEAAKLITPETISPEARQKLSPVDIIKLGCYQSSQKVLLFCVESSLKHFKSNIPTMTIVADMGGLEGEDQELLKNLVTEFQVSSDQVYEEGKIFEDGIPVVILAMAEEQKSVPK